MNILLLSGLGPSWPQGSAFYDSKMLKETFLDKKVYHSGLNEYISIEDFYIDNDGNKIDLFRKRNGIEKNLTKATLENILDNCDCYYDSVDLEKVWNNEDVLLDGDPDIVFLSTTFICNFRDLEYAINWINKHYENIPIAVGGQFSNLKYKKIMESYSNIKFIMRGDGENSIPSLINAINENEDLSIVPNLVWRKEDDVICNDVQLINMDTIEPIKLKKGALNVYYESMRGCAYSCKFCSFPAASPKWRYKSAEKIASDWEYYHDEFGVKRVRAMDSAFTFPKKRLEQLMNILKDKDIEWEAYSRADIITSPDMIERLEKSNCRLLSIGFESLSDSTLRKMNKRVTSEQNRKANSILNEYAQKMDFRGSFIVGFPGETPLDFSLTHDFLVNEYKKQFHLSVFSLIDETMPIWHEANKYDLKVEDIDNPDYSWSHNGMDSDTARKLHQQTLFDVRWNNEYAVAVEWQLPYDLPLNPNLDFTKNYRIEKLIERLAFVDNDFYGQPDKIKDITNSIVEELKEMNVYIKPLERKKENYQKVLKK